MNSGYVTSPDNDILIMNAIQGRNEERRFLEKCKLYLPHVMKELNRLGYEIKRTKNSVS